MIVDLGTGDGRVVLARAAAEPDALVIGIDANASAMAGASRRAQRGRTRLANAWFLVAAAEALPGPLAGVASLVTITMPWGSLLRGALGLDGELALRGAASVVVPGGRVEVLLSVVAADRVDGLETLDADAATRIAAAWRSVGFELVSMRPASRADLAATRSSWARRLGDRPVWRLDLDGGDSPGAGLGAHLASATKMGDTSAQPKSTQRADRASAASGGPANVAKVTMPQLGESVAEGTIGKWLKQPGDHVDKYEPLVEVITDKVNAEVPSPFEGILREILAEEGATVPNNAEIAVIETADEGSADAVAAPAAPTATAEAPRAEAPTSASTPQAPAPEPAAGPAGSDERGPREMAAATAAPAVATPASLAAAPALGDADARMTPAVRRLLREHELSAAQIVGTGGGGRITREDVLKVVEAIRTGATAPAAPGSSTGRAAIGIAPVMPAPARTPAPSSAPAAGTPVVFPDGADEVLIPMTRMRQGIAAQMTRALAVPHAYVHMEADAQAMVRAREATKREYQAREGVSLSYVPFVIKAVVDALRRFPTFNAHWTEAGLVAKRHIHMGVAVAVDDGLLVPVVRDVDLLSINGLNHAIAEVAERARAGKLKLEDYGGSTFTIDNTGWFGSNLTMPIINVPEVAILTMEAITKRPVVRETPDGDVIAIRPIMNLVLAIDHRANDGAGAAAFLRAIKAGLEGIGPETPVY